MKFSMKIATRGIQKEESKLGVYNMALDCMSHELLLFYEKMVVVAYELVTRKNCNYDWSDDGDRFYDVIVPKVNSALEETDNEDLIQLRTLFDSMEDVRSKYFKKSGIYFEMKKARNK